MKLFRIFAFEVAPQRLIKRAEPRGGAISNRAAVQKILDDFTEKSGLARKQAVAFRTHEPEDSKARFNPVRTLILDFIFGTGPKSAAAARQLATRLGGSMDDRSPYTLLLLSAYEDDETKRVTMWALPKDEPFHFEAKGSKAQITLLKNAFSKTSHFRKAALIEGIDRDVDFWKPRIIDKQGELGDEAAYWINAFLDSRYAMTADTGSRLLATTLRGAFDSLDARDDRDQILNSIGAIHASKRPKWSLAAFAKEFLDGTAKEAFLRRAPLDTRNSQFAFSATAFDAKLNFRVFRLDNGVVVSAPFEEIGKTVRLQGDDTRTLSCSGNVVQEKVRAKHAG